VLGIINSFTSFTQAYVVSGGTGAPARSTLFYALYLYQQAFGNVHDMGYAAALAWVLLVIVGSFTAINFWASKKWVHYGD
jgi:multiple sugar transport system permease protein